MATLTGCFRSAAIWSAPFATLTMAVLGERVIVHHPKQFAVFPWTDEWDRWLRPGIANPDEKIAGYIIMAVAAMAFAIALRRRPSSEVPAPKAQSGAAVTTRSQLIMTAAAVTAALMVAAIMWGYALHEVWSRQRDTRSPILIVIAFLIVAGLVIQRDRRANVRFSLDVPLWEAAMIASLVIASAVVLGYQLDDLPRGIVGDEGSFWEAAIAHEPREIARDPFRPAVYGFPLASTLPPSLAANVFGQTVFAWRLSSVVFLILTVAPLYFLARSLFGRTAAFSTVGVFISSPYLLAFGRLGYNNIQSIFPVVLSSALVVAALSRRSAFLFFVAGGAAGLGFYTYTAARFMPALIGIAIMHAGIVHRMTWRDALSALTLAALGTIIIGFPPALSGFVDPAPDSRRKIVEALFLHEGYVRSVFHDVPVDRFTEFEVSGATLLYDPMITLRLLGRGIARTLLSFHDPTLVQAHYIRGPLAARWASALVLPGMAIALLRWRSSGHVMLLAWTVLVMILFSIINGDPPQDTHMVVIIPVLSMWIGATIGAMAGHIASLEWRAARWLGPTTAVLAVCTLGVLGVREYRDAAPRFFAHAEMAVWWEAMELEDGEHVVWVYPNQPGYDDKIPLGIRMFDLEDHYWAMHYTDLDDPDRRVLARSAEVVVVAANRVADPVEHDAPLTAAKLAMPEWSIEPVLNLGEQIGWIFRPPEEFAANGDR